MCDSAITRSDRENDLFVGNAAGQTGPSYTLLVILVTQAIVLTFTLYLFNKEIKTNFYSTSTPQYAYHKSIVTPVILIYAFVYCTVTNNSLFDSRTSFRLK